MSTASELYDYRSELYAQMRRLAENNNPWGKVYIHTEIAIVDAELTKREGLL